MLRRGTKTAGRFGGVPALALAAVASCAAPRLERREYERPAMGTTFRIVLYATDRMAADRAAEATFARIAELDATLSDYREDSEMSRLGARSDAGAPTEPVAVGEDLWRVLERSAQVSRASDGAFDVTVGPITLLWRRARRQGEPPDDEKLRGALGAVGWEKLELDPARRTARLHARGMRLDLGGIAKGYALDEALAALASRGIDRALVDGGGDVAVGRAPPGCSGWRIELAPFAGETGTAAVELENAAVATSGDTFQALEAGGARHSHIVDPRTGRALTRRTAASVVARDGMTADALATAACVLGPGRGLALAGRFGAEARVTVLDEDGERTVATGGFSRRILSAPLPPPRTREPEVRP